MPDKTKVEDLLGGKSQTETPEEENTLEKMNKISKEKPAKQATESKTLDHGVLEAMIKTGENTDGMFTPDSEEEHEEEHEDAKVKIGKDIKPEGKYKKDFKNDLLKHPDMYKVKTPAGEMTVAEAIRKGYNPITRRFEKKHSQENIKEKHLSKLNDADREALEKLTSPEAAQVAPADAEMYGLSPSSPLVKQEQPGAAPLGGMPTEQPPMVGGPTGIGAAMPGAQESQAAGGLDLSALLGGNA